MALFITVIAGDFGDIPPSTLGVASLLFLILSGLNGISSSCSRVTVSTFLFVLFCSVRLFFLDLFNLLRGLGSLFSLVGLALVLALTLKGRTGFRLVLFRLIAGVDTHL